MVEMQPAPPRSSPLKWILIGCLGVFLFGALLVGGCLFALFKVTAEPVKAGEDFLQAMSAGDAAKAKGLCGPGVSVETLLKDPAVWGTGWTITGRYVESKNGVTTARVIALVPGRDGKSRSIEMSLVNNGGWKLSALMFDGQSPTALPESPKSIEK